MQNSDHIDNPMEALEVYENKKLFAFKGLIVSFIAWQLGQIMLSNFAELLHSSVTMVCHFLNVFGAIGWVGFIFYLIKISRFLKGDSKLNNQVNDERLSLIRLRAMSYGFIVTLGVTALFFAATVLVDSFAVNFELSGAFVAQSIILVAVSSTWISYLILDKNE